MIKIVFHIGESIGRNTIVNRGFLDDDTQQMFIQFEDKTIPLDNLQRVESINLGLGTMVKVQNWEDTIYLAVPRIFINIRTGFAIINYFATKKVKSSLECAMHYQNSKK